MIVFAWVMLSFVGAWIASLKQRSFWLFLLLGLVCSPLVGLIAAILVKSDEKKIKAEKIESGELRTCTHCGAVGKWSLARCSGCGLDLEAVSPPTRWNGVERRRNVRKLSADDKDLATLRSG